MKSLFLCLIILGGIIKRVTCPLGRKLKQMYNKTPENANKILSQHARKPKVTGVSKALLEQSGYRPSAFQTEYVPVKATSRKTGRHINLFPLSQRDFPPLPLTPLSLVAFFSEYLNRSQVRALLVILKDCRKKGKTTVAMDRVYISRGMGMQEIDGGRGLDMISGYTNTLDDFGIAAKKYRCDKNSNYPNIYRLHPNFEDSTYLNEVILILEGLIATNAIQKRVPSSLVGITSFCKNIIISIWNSAFRTKDSPKSTHTTIINKLREEDRDRTPQRENGESFCLEDDVGIPNQTDMAETRGELEGVPRESDAPTASDLLWVEKMLGRENPIHHDSMQYWVLPKDVSSSNYDSDVLNPENELAEFEDRDVIFAGKRIACY